VIAGSGSLSARGLRRERCRGLGARGRSCGIGVSGVRDAGRGHNKWGGAAYRSGISSRDAVAFTSIRATRRERRRTVGRIREAYGRKSIPCQVLAPAAARNDRRRGSFPSGRRETDSVSWTRRRIGRDAEEIPRQVRPQDPAGKRSPYLNET